MIAFSLGLLIGFLMCIPIGPLNVWVMNTRLKKGRAMAICMAAGGSIMDFVYFFIILSGLSLIEFSQGLTFGLKALGVGLIFLLGLKELFSNPVVVDIKAQKYPATSLLKSLLLGVLIYTSNPTLILTMTGLGAFVKSLELFPFSWPYIVLHCSGLALGSLAWFYALVLVVERYETALRERYLQHFTRLSGILMIFLSFLMTFRWLIPK